MRVRRSVILILVSPSRLHAQSRNNARFTEPSATEIAKTGFFPADIFVQRQLDFCNARFRAVHAHACQPDLIFNVMTFSRKGSFATAVRFSNVIGRVQQTQLSRRGSVSARCYWCILLDHPIAASAHGFAPQQLSLLNATIGCVQQRKQLSKRFALIGLYF